jgi:hypothetical protein
VTETKETTCSDQKDNDCDAKTDCADSDCINGAYCKKKAEMAAMDAKLKAGTSQTKKCFKGGTAYTINEKSLCEYGNQTYLGNGKWSACKGGTGPTTEACNGYDDDCDGSVDEGCGGCKSGETKVCGSISGSCGGGLMSCNSKGFWDACAGTGFISPKKETCNQVDDDCDGEIDEDCACTEGANQSCGRDTGACQKGTQTCVNKKWSDCTNEIKPIKEICYDSVDNDCDGKVDSQDDDCKASSSLTPTCTDAIKNQGETGLDCGGPNCKSCTTVTCNDRQMNGDEIGIDCGGSKCPACKKTLRSSPTKTTTTTTSTDDCGDGTCDSTSEDYDSCPSDCKKPFSILSIIIPILLLLVLGGGGYILYKKGILQKYIKIKGSKKPSSPPRPGFARPGMKPPSFKKPLGKPTAQKPATPPRTFGGPRAKRTKVEDAFEKSLKESQDIFKKADEETK